MPEYLKAQIRVYCDLIKKGKPAAMLPVQTRYEREAKDIIRSYGLEIFIEQLSEGWLTLWIYKDPYLLEVIKRLPQTPETIYDHWVLGKLFGYSEEAIREFIESSMAKCGKENPAKTNRR